MEKNVLTIFTGGTICTTVKDGKMSTDPSAAAALIDCYEHSDSPFKDCVYLEKGKMFGILSENMTTHKWNAIIEYFRNDVMPDIKNYDGIIVAHGTDTLAYSTALFSVLLKNIQIPVFFVSSNYSIMNEDGTLNKKANGNDNFRAAVECICKGIRPNVYATYKNSEDGRMYLHKGSNLIQCAIYSDNFYSADAIDITDGGNLPTGKADTGELLITKTAGKKLTDCVLKIDPYVGLNYKMFDLSKVKAVLHSTYHSGTACVVKTKDAPDYLSTNNSVLYLIDRCAEGNIPFYFSPSRKSSTQTVYDSVPFIENHVVNGQSARFYYGMTEELMYAKLVIAYSFGFSEAETEKLLG